MAAINGTDNADTLTGTEDPDLINGLDGDDVLSGLGGNDTLDGGAGADQLFGGGGNDTLIGGAGDDTLRGEDGDDTITDLSGRVNVDGGAGNDRFFLLDPFSPIGSAPIGTVVGGDGVDSIVGGAQSLDLRGLTFTGVENLYATSAGAKADQFNSFKDIRGANDGGAATPAAPVFLTVYGAGTADFSRNVANPITLTVQAGTAGLTLIGHAGSDVLINSSNDTGVTLIGGDGDDTLRDMSSNVNMSGGAGNDRLQVGAFGTVTSRPGGIASGGDGIDTLAVVPTLPGGVADLSNLNITGVERLLAMVVSARADQFNAFSDIRAAADDTAAAPTTAVNLTLTMAGAVDFSRNVASTAALTVNGSFGDDVITGHSGADTLIGGGGNDTLIGAGGDDTLIDVFGSVNMDGGAGNDTFAFSDVNSFGVNSTPSGTVAGGDGVDTIASSNNYPVDISNLAITGVERLIANQTAGRPDQFNSFSEIVSSFPGAVLTLTSAGSVDFSRNVGTSLALNVSGTEVADTIIGHAGVDAIRGRGGADILTGGAGADIFVYGVGESTGAARDTITDFQSGVDRIDLTSTGATVTTLVRMGDLTRVLSQGAFGAQTEIDVRGTIQGGDLMIGAGAGLDILGQDGVGDTLVGSAGADHLFGFSGSDRLDGGAGDDQLFGDGGADVLIGGAGADRFAYRGVGDSNATDGFDIITDFVSGTDKLDLYYLSGVTAVSLVRSGGGTIAFAATPMGQVQVGFTGAVQGSDLINPFGTASTFGYDLVGESVNDTLIGSNGNDKLFGLAGSDTLNGGFGDDQLFGDAGADVLIGGTGADRFAYRNVSDSNATDGYDIITDFVGGLDKLDFSYLNGVQSIALVRSGVGTIVFVSTAAGQLQVGVTGPVAGLDIINPFGTAATFGYDLVGTDARDYMIGSAGNDQMFGVGGDDLLSGNAGSDVIYGGAGDDTIYGDAGGDLLSGGAGADQFAYRFALDSTLAAPDRILDFQTGVDKINLRGVHGLGTDKYGFVVQGSDTQLFVDLGSDGINDMLIVVSGVTNLQNSDILF